MAYLQLNWRMSEDFAHVFSCANTVKPDRLM
jgi:hypothetical protein